MKKTTETDDEILQRLSERSSAPLPRFRKRCPRARRAEEAARRDRRRQRALPPRAHGEIRDRIESSFFESRIARRVIGCRPYGGVGKRPSRATPLHGKTTEHPSLSRRRAAVPHGLRRPGAARLDGAEPRSPRPLFRRRRARFPAALRAVRACAPSRTSIFTGQYPSLHGVSQTDGIGKTAWDPGMSWLDPNTVPTMGDWFRAAGYRTYYKGKWHISHADIEIPGTHKSLIRTPTDGHAHPQERRYLPSRRSSE